MLQVLSNRTVNTFFAKYSLFFKKLALRTANWVELSNNGLNYRFLRNSIPTPHKGDVKHFSLLTATCGNSKVRFTTAILL